MAEEYRQMGRPDQYNHLLVHLLDGYGFNTLAHQFRDLPFVLDWIGLSPLSLHQLDHELLYDDHLLTNQLHYFPRSGRRLQLLDLPVREIFRERN